MMILNAGQGYFSLYSFEAGACIRDCCANVLIRSRTTVIPLSSDALSSSTLDEKSSGPNSSLDNARIVLVFPVPGGPYISRCGKAALLSIRRRTLTTWSWDLTSSRVFGLYFSTHGCIRGAAGASWVCLVELDPFSAANFARALLSKKEADILSSRLWPRGGCLKVSLRHQDCGLLETSGQRLGVKLISSNWLSYELCAIWNARYECARVLVPQREKSRQDATN